MASASKEVPTVCYDNGRQRSPFSPSIRVSTRLTLVWKLVKLVQDKFGYPFSLRTRHHGVGAQI